MKLATLPAIDTLDRLLGEYALTYCRSPGEPG